MTTPITQTTGAGRETEPTAFERLQPKLFAGLNKTPTEVRIVLPFPLSTHQAFRKFNGKHLSQKYRDWRDEAGWTLKQQRPLTIAGRVTILIELRAPNKIRRDGDNYKKGVIDLLVTHGIIEADDNRFVVESTVKWVSTGEPCVVTVRAI
jgi:Holliday junction resolvase RusA-like endonuclease